jgi:hypothetical protein
LEEIIEVKVNLDNRLTIKDDLTWKLCKLSKIGPKEDVIIYINIRDVKIWSDPMGQPDSIQTQPDSKWSEDKWDGYESRFFDPSWVGSGMDRPDPTRPV